MPTDVPSNAPSAFFSYCRADSDFALKLAEDLKAAGANVWIDQLDIEPGTPWDGAVEDALRNAPRMLVILSTVSVASANVRDEISYALDHQKRIIPLLVSDCDIPIRLARLQHIDFRTDYARGLRFLLRSLGVATQAPAPTLAEVAAEKRLAAEQEQLEAAKRQSAAESLRLEQERERLAAEQARFEEERKQAAAEKARLEQLDRERRAAEENARQEQAERDRQAAVEQARRAQAERQTASEQVPPQPPPFQKTPVVTAAKLPAWSKLAAGVAAAVIASWVLYAALSPKKQPTSENQQSETQSQQTQPANQPPANQPESANETNPTPSPTEPATTTSEKAKPKPQAPPPTTTASKLSSTDASRGLTQKPVSSTDTAAASVPLGLSADKAEKYRKALAGDAGAMVELGFAYEKGNGAPQDYKKAVYWYRKAAENGSVAGMTSIGWFYYTGDGTPKDYAQALSWSQKAAGLGNAQAMNNIGVFYEHGAGVQQDKQQAAYWYRKAAEHGSVQAMTSIGWFYYTGDGTPKDYAQALSWNQKAAGLGNAQAMNNIGVFYEHGAGVQQDKQQAIYWYRKAAQLGLQQAKDNLKLLGENP